MFCKLCSSDCIRKHLNTITSKTYKMYSQSCTIAVCQLTSTNDKNENLKSVKRLVTEAANKNAKVIFLPEGCDYVGTTKEETKSLAESLDGPLLNEYQNLAKIHNIWLSIGGFHEIDVNLKLNNCHILINDKGVIETVYRKLHLFDVSIPEKNVHLKESGYVNAGKEIVKPVATPAGAVAPSICYDMRFPELSVLLRKRGAEILTFPSAFTNTTGEAHWEILLRARAIENQCYVVAAAQYGCHNKKRISYGQSLIIDPWGRIVAECPKYNASQSTNESFALGTINRELLEKVRTDMPVFEHRRDDIYCLLSTNNGRQEPIASPYNFGNKIIPAATVFYITEFSYAFTNIRCVVPGHVLVAPIRVAKRLEDLKPVEVADLFQTVVKVQKILETVHEARSSTICVQDGKDAGQTVPHVHVHILPRKSGDFDRNDDIYDALAKHDREDTPLPLRSIDEMSAEALKLKTYFS